MAKRRPPTIGEYRHEPRTERVVGGDGIARLRNVRRRFRHAGMVPLATATMGCMVAGVTQFSLNQLRPGWTLHPIGDTPLPPAPSYDNLLFGAGLPEIAAGCALMGWLFWRSLWSTPSVDEEGRVPLRSAVKEVVPRALCMGPVYLFGAAFVASVGLYIRTGPPDQTAPLRALSGLLGGPIVLLSALVHPIIPITLTLLGWLHGLTMGLSVAVLAAANPPERMNN